jgi:TolB-like protein/Tfp pilus assembly protein PilF
VAAETSGRHDRLDSWKEIAAYLGRSDRTVRRWEAREGLPVHRLQHEKKGSVYAYRGEVDAWRESRKPLIDAPETGYGIVTLAGGRGRRWALAAAAAVLLVVLAAALLVETRHGRRSAVSSIAVLPFDNLTGSEEWFSDGMTETLITELVKLRDIRVVARTSVMRYKHARQPIQEIARELGVDVLVEGSVVGAGDSVRITAQLIDASTGTHLWGSDFDVEMKDVLTVHRAVARAIAQEVGAVMTPAGDRRPQDSPVPPEAMAAYLKGLYQFNRGALEQATELAREAIRLAPDLAQAHELLGASLVLSADFHSRLYRDIMPEARAALNTALKLEPNRGVATSWLGWTYFVLEHDWDRAEPLLRRGGELDPGTGLNYAFFLLAQGKNAEALRLADIALDRDPANPFVLADAARVYHLARHFEEAIALQRKAQDLDPTMAYARLFEPYSLLLAGRPEEAFERWLWPPENGPLGLGQTFREVYSTGGWPAVWTLYVSRFPRDSHLTRFDIYALVLLDRHQEAIDELEGLEPRSDSWMIHLQDPMFDPLRGDPRFKALMQRVGYPAQMWQRQPS